MARPVVTSHFAWRKSGNISRAAWRKKSTSFERSILMPRSQGLFRSSLESDVGKKEQDKVQYPVFALSYILVWHYLLSLHVFYLVDIFLERPMAFLTRSLQGTLF